MSYKSILLNLNIDGPIEPVTRIGVNLAKRFDARLIGFCAADAPLPVTMAPEGAAIAADIWEQSRDEIRRRLTSLKGEFDGLVAGAVKTDWHGDIENPNHAVARRARMADIVVTSASQGASTGDSYRTVDPGSLVLRAGRPILVAAQGAMDLPARRIVVSWKDTREARRAVADAVPLMAMAEEVTIVAVDRNPDDWTRDSVKDVASFLAGHGIKARTEIIKTADDESNRLVDFFASMNAELIVSGAYGHSRLREWVFGGVTRSLLDEVWLNRLMSN
ncbi:MULTISPECIES: universal stress protein [unclassified Mesorhizobium]|uniref:universal stress protein n=2 Tax=Mesorhizobium TaxID=68287 RepID=UPI000F74D890|nr:MULTISPECIES: universal stress protein [unclassified Mesorhizobium]AZO05447.1 universal stress protein [Mesorhizobium sp. M2A.F.Ca.ET.043.02.1.1]RUW40791.1 universal stress protein [Mesorhizobium sp. M2A.F.Ca.ET.015.02.1.1]RVC94147.1 universal stress protein [Mesorhizobium sp. M2A.F.Ca.ET.017.03.2.1]RVD10695.1 universal stress protein [Mesorhizobium sp. M2A.F.Ca.ET.029.05.1.1]RWB49208.1 MAG: universal stress protein [Mesorhizobium sp.]